MGQPARDHPGPMPGRQQTKCRDWVHGRRAEGQLWQWRAAGSVARAHGGARAGCSAARSSSPSPWGEAPVSSSWASGERRPGVEGSRGGGDAGRALLGPKEYRSGIFDLDLDQDGIYRCRLRGQAPHRPPPLSSSSPPQRAPFVPLRPLDALRPACVAPPAATPPHRSQRPTEAEPPDEDGQRPLWIRSCHP